MVGVKNLRNRFLLLVVCILLSSHSQQLEASPWAVPGELIIRHDIQLLVDSGVINIPITTWPLAWGDIAYNLSKTEKEMTSLELASFQRIKEVLLLEEMGGLSGESSLRFTNKTKRVNWFNDSVGSSSEIEAESTYLGRNFEINLHVNRTGGQTLLDESYIAIALGDYSISLGSKKNWWGPGWDGSLILSTNARPIPGISLERNFSNPFEYEFLKWIGPWDMSLLIGQLEDSRARPNTLFFGMRVGFRPLTNLEIGLSRSALLCGKDTSCGVSDFSKMFFDLASDNNKPSEQNSAYQLAGFDFRSSHQIKGIPFALYGQIIGEEINESILDSKPFALGLFGLETWGSINEYSLLESYRVFLEATSTTCEFFNYNDLKFGCAYYDPLYQDGYRYEGNNIGHSAEADALLITLGGMIVVKDSQLLKSSVSLGKLNQGSINQNQFTQNTNAYFKFDLGYEFDLFWFDIPLGNFDLGLGMELLRDTLRNTTQKDPSIYLSWSNSINFNPKKVRNYSEYLKLIEVGEDEDIVEEQPSEIEIKTTELLVVEGMALSELIILIDKITLGRNSESEKENNKELIKTRISPKQSMENDLTSETLISEGQLNLTEIMLQLDQTIENRN